MKFTWDEQTDKFPIVRWNPIDQLSQHVQSKSFLERTFGILINMADLVERVLQEAAERESHYKTIEVHKDIELEIDPGNLLTVDTNPLDVQKLK